MHNKCKDTIFRGLVFCTVIFLSIITYSVTALVCPSVSIEYGSTRVISCESDRAISDFYWYRGHYSNSTPILILDTAGKGGTEYGSEHFDILPNGSMVLTDVKTEHESYYSFVGYYENRQSERAIFSVNVTISPDPSCPLIHVCDACTECDVYVQEETGTLTCEIKGVRPLLKLSWKFISQTGVNFVTNHPEVHKNAEIESWNTFVSLKYTITDSCEVSGEVKCVARDHSNILQWNTSTVKIKNADICKDTVSTNFSSLAAIWASVATIVVVLGLICVVIAYNRCTRRALNRGGVIEMVYYNAALVLPTKAKVKLLVRSLKEAYAKYCELTPLPWDNICIPVTDLFTDCQCTAWGKDLSTFELMNDRKIIHEKRVIVIGDHGTGRTTLTKYFVHQWIQDNSSTYLLIYIPLREVTLTTKLSDFVKSDLSTNRPTSLEEEDIEKILSSGGIRCIVILDGYEDLSKSCNERTIEMTNEDQNEEGDERNKILQTDTRITIGKLLKGDLQGYPDVHVWLTSRKVDYKTSTLSDADGTKVTMSGFSEDQKLEYIKKCCVYYSRISGEQNELLENNTCDDVSESSNNSSLKSLKLHERESKSTDSEQSDVIIRINEKVIKFMRQNDIFEDFRKTPLLFNIIVHVMSGKYTSAISYLKDKVITNVSTLMRIVINCMEERYLRKKNLLEKDFASLELKIGKFAFQRYGEQVIQDVNVWIRGIGNDALDASLNIGLLKLSQNTPAGVSEMDECAKSSSEIEFYHRHIQDYLVAGYIVKNTGCLQTLLEKLVEDADEKSSKVLIFISKVLQEANFQQLCDTLQIHEQYNTLIDCLYENGDYSILPKTLKNSAEIQIEINHLESTYHRKAVRTFCKKCKNLKIKLCSISFKADPISFKADLFLSFLQHFSLPSYLKSVEFSRMELCEANFHKICDWLTRQQVTDVLRFKECTLPKKISRDPEEVGKPSETESNSTLTFFYSTVTKSWGLSSLGTAV